MQRSSPLQPGGSRLGAAPGPRRPASCLASFCVSRIPLSCNPFALSESPSVLPLVSFRPYLFWPPFLIAKFSRLGFPTPNETGISQCLRYREARSEKQPASTVSPDLGTSDSFRDVRGRTAEITGYMAMSTGSGRPGLGGTRRPSLPLNERTACPGLSSWASLISRGRLIGML